MENKKVVGVFIGQSFDFDGIASNLWTVTRGGATFFKIDISDAPIKIFEGLDINKLKEEREWWDSELIPSLELSLVNVPAKVLKGKAEGILEAICNSY